MNFRHRFQHLTFEMSSSDEASCDSQFIFFQLRGRNSELPIFPFQEYQESLDLFMVVKSKATVLVRQ